MIFDGWVVTTESICLSLLVSEIVSGLFGLDCHDLSIDVLLNLVCLFLAEHVDGTWDNLGNTGDDVGLDDLLVDRDLVPFGLAVDGSLDVDISRSDRCIRCRNDVLDSSEFSGVVTSNLELGELLGLVIESCFEAEELISIGRSVNFLGLELSGHVDGAARDSCGSKGELQAEQRSRASSCVEGDASWTSGGELGLGAASGQVSVCGSGDLIGASAIVELEANDGWNKEVSAGVSIGGEHVALADLDLLRLVRGTNLVNHLKVGSCERSKITSLQHSASNCGSYKRLGWEEIIVASCKRGSSGVPFVCNSCELGSLRCLEICPVARVLGAPDDNLVGNLGLEAANLVIDTVDLANIASLNCLGEHHLGIVCNLGSETCSGSRGFRSELAGLSSQIRGLVANPVQFGSQFAKLAVCSLNEGLEASVFALPCESEVSGGNRESWNAIGESLQV